MAVTQSNVLTNGSKYRQVGNLVERTFRLVGDGVGATVNLAFGKIRRIKTVTVPYPFTINNTTKVVAVEVPAGLANTKIVEARIAGI